MARLCLPKEYRDKLGRALKSGKLSLEDLYGAKSSADRRAMFAKYVDDSSAKIVNSKFEQAMLSNQKKALKNWVLQTAQKKHLKDADGNLIKDADGKPILVDDLKDPIRRDMMKRVERIERFLTPDEKLGFLDDLAETKLGLRVSEEEAGEILRLKSRADDLLTKVDRSTPDTDVSRFRYGMALKQFRNYTGEMMVEAEKMSLKERTRLSAQWDNFVDASGLSKALKATGDVSFIGRQGIKALLSWKFGVWYKGVKNALKLFGKEMVAENARWYDPATGKYMTRPTTIMDAVDASILGRENNLNGKYAAAKNSYGVFEAFEEAIPTSWPDKIPGLGKIFKASETSFSGTAKLMRADLADAFIAAAEKNQVDMLDEVNATSMGILTSSLTGRGDIGKLASHSKMLNAVFFSIRFLKSNIDTLTMHAFNKNVTRADKIASAKNLGRIGISLATILITANVIKPGSAGVDPRNKKTFGKIHVGDKWIDITGGLGGLVAFGFKFVPTIHNGEVGWWTKSENTQKWTKAGSGGYGEATLMDAFESFFEGKLSPTAGTMRDILEWQTFSGESPTIGSTVRGLAAPISAETIYDELQKGGDDLLITTISEGLGFSPSDAIPGGYTKKFKQLKAEEDAETYNAALKKYWLNFKKRSDKLKDSRRWSRMTTDEQNKELDKIRKEEADRVLSRYGI